MFSDFRLDNIPASVRADALHIPHHQWNVYNVQPQHLSLPSGITNSGGAEKIKRSVSTSVGFLQKQKLRIVSVEFFFFSCLFCVLNILDCFLYRVWFIKTTCWGFKLTLQKDPFSTVCSLNKQSAPHLFSRPANATRSAENLLLQLQ